MLGISDSNVTEVSVLPPSTTIISKFGLFVEALRKYLTKVTIVFASLKIGIIIVIKGLSIR